MNNLSFQKIPDHFQSSINRIKDTKLKNIYHQFVFSYFSPYYIDNANHEKNQINDFLSGFLKKIKFIVYKISNQFGDKNQIQSKNHDKSQIINFTFLSFLCVEKKFLIIEGINNDVLLQILNNLDSKLIDVENSLTDEIKKFNLYFSQKEDYINNVFVQNTLSTISVYLIQRFFYPSFYFEDSSFFLYKEKEKMPEQKFQEKFRKLLESKSIEELQNDDIIEIFKTINNDQYKFENFFETDFIELKNVHVKENSSYYMVFHLDSLLLFLMKKFNNQKMNEFQFREAEFCLKYSHRCFIKCYGFLKNKDMETIGLIYEYICNGTLSKFITKYENKITPLFSFMTMIRIFQALKYLNINKIVHRDLKPSNILLNHDFVPFISDNETVRKIDENTNFTNDIGCLAYMSPEQLNGEILSCQSDIYSFGLIIYFLFEHKDLISCFSKCGKNIDNVEIGNMKNCTKNIKEICYSCLKEDPNSRIKNEELEDIIYNEIKFSNYFQLYFSKDKCQEIIDFETDKYLYENIMSLSQYDSLDKLKIYFFSMYYNICDKLTKVDKYKSSAFNNIGNLFYCGIGVLKNYFEAKKYFKLACELNNSISMNNLGDMYKRGNGVKQDYTKAKYYYELAAKQNNPEAFYNLGYLYYNGYGVKKSIVTAEQYFEKSANLNNTHGLNALGYLNVAKNGKREEGIKAKECYEKAIKLNNLNSYLNLAYLYIEGIGVVKDYEHAVMLYQKAASKNHNRALHHLGKMYKKGLGVEKDLNKAKEYFEKATLLGNMEAAHSLGNLYLHGKGVEVNYKMARDCYLIAAEQSIRSSLYKLGMIYEKGLGVKKDWLIAKNYYELAAEEGYYSAYINLANFYLNGEYFEVDEEKAIGYYLKNMSTNNEKVIFERNGFYRTRKNFGYYPSHNDIALIYLFRNEGEKVMEYLKIAVHSDYQLALNSFAVLYDPSIPKDKKHFDKVFTVNNSNEKNFEIAYEKYNIASKLNFSLAEFNFAHMLEEKGDKENAVHYYELASEHEHYPLIFHSRERYDKRLNVSISFITLFIDCKLFLHFLESKNYEKAKKYFIKIILKLKNENEMKFFPYIKDMFFEKSCLTDQIKSKKCKIISDDISLKCNFLNLENIKPKKIEIKNNNNKKLLLKSAGANYQQDKSEIKIIKNDPEQQFYDIIENELNKSFFIQKIKNVISLMKNILYTPPYYILFGRIIINDPSLKIPDKKAQNINNDFYEGFGIPI